MQGCPWPADMPTPSQLQGILLSKRLKTHHLRPCSQRPARSRQPAPLARTRPLTARPGDRCIEKPAMPFAVDSASGRYLVAGRMLKRSCRCSALGWRIATRRRTEKLPAFRTPSLPIHNSRNPIPRKPLRGSTSRIVPSAHSRVKAVDSARRDSTDIADADAEWPPCRPLNAGPPVPLRHPIGPGYLMDQGGHNAASRRPRPGLSADHKCPPAGTSSRLLNPSP